MKFNQVRFIKPGRTFLQNLMWPPTKGTELRQCSQRTTKT